MKSISVYLLSSIYIARVYKKTANYKNQPVKSAKNAKPIKGYSYKKNGIRKKLLQPIVMITDHEINLLSIEGWKFIPTPLTKEQHFRRQLLQHFEQFARRVRLKYIFHGQKNKENPYEVKLNRLPLFQPSVALERYLEEVKWHWLEEIKPSKPKATCHQTHYIL